MLKRVPTRGLLFWDVSGVGVAEGVPERPVLVDDPHVLAPSRLGVSRTGGDRVGSPSAADRIAISEPDAGAVSNCPSRVRDEFGCGRVGRQVSGRDGPSFGAETLQHVVVQVGSLVVDWGKHIGAVEFEIHRDDLDAGPAAVAAWTAVTSSPRSKRK